jgi:hypothetical protein
MQVQEASGWEAQQHQPSEALPSDLLQFNARHGWPHPQSFEGEVFLQGIDNA